MFLIFLCSFSELLTTTFFWIAHSYTFLWVSQVVLVVKNLPANAKDIIHSGSIPELGRSPGGGNGNPLWKSYLENPMDRGACQATVHRVAKVGHNWSNLATMFWFNESQKISPVPLSPAPWPFNSSDLARVTHTFLFLSLISVHMPGTSSSFSAPTCFWNSNYCLYFTSGCQSVHHITSEEVRKNKLTTCSENGIPGKSLC